MVKRISLILIVIVILSTSLIACAQTTIPEEDYMMMEAVHVNDGQTSSEEDYWVSTTYRLSSQGQLERVKLYNISGNTTETCIIKEEKLLQIIKILNDLKRIKAESEIMDGSSWDIKYYDKDGQIISDYNGPILDQKKMKTLIELLNKEFGSNMLLLYAQKSFVGINEETGKEASVSIVYTVLHNGKVSIQTSSTDAETKTQTASLSMEELTIIKDGMERQRTETSSNQLIDGVTWEFKYCDENGERLKSFLGNIDEFENLIQIAELLQKIN